MGLGYVLSRKSLEALEVDVPDGRSFIPDVQLDNLMTLRAIHGTIKERCKDSGRDCESENLAHEILSHSKTVFAILVLIGEEGLIQDFFQERHMDSSLLHSEFKIGFGSTGIVYRVELHRDQQRLVTGELSHNWAQV